MPSGMLMVTASALTCCDFSERGWAVCAAAVIASPATITAAIRIGKIIFMISWVAASWERQLAIAVLKGYD